MLFRSLVISLILGLLCKAEYNPAQIEITPSRSVNYENLELLDSAVLVSMVNRQSKVPEPVTTFKVESPTIAPTQRDYEQQDQDAQLDVLVNKIIDILAKEETHVEPTTDDDITESMTEDDINEPFDEEPLDEVHYSGRDEADDSDYETNTTAITINGKPKRRRYRGRHRGSKRRQRWHKRRRFWSRRRHGGYEDDGFRGNSRREHRGRGRYKGFTSRKIDSGILKVNDNETSTEEGQYEGGVKFKGYRKRYKSSHGCEGKTEIPQASRNDNETITDNPNHNRSSKRNKGCKERHKGNRRRHGYWYTVYKRRNRPNRFRNKGRFTAFYNHGTSTYSQSKTAYTQWRSSLDRTYDGPEYDNFDSSTSVEYVSKTRAPFEAQPTRQYHLARPEQSSVESMGKTSDYYKKYFTRDGTFFVEYVSKTSTQFEVRPTKQSTYWSYDSSTSSTYDDKIYQKGTSKIPDEIATATTLYPSTDSYASSTTTKYAQETTARTESLSTSSNQYFLGEGTTIFEGPSSSAFSTKYKVRDGSTVVEHTPVISTGRPSESSTKKIHLRRGEQHTLLNGPINSDYHTYYQTCDESIFVDFVSTTTTPSPFFCGTETLNPEYYYNTAAADYEQYPSKYYDNYNYGDY